MSFRLKSWGLTNLDSTTGGGGQGKEKGIHLVLQPGEEPNKTDNRTRARHGWVRSQHSKSNCTWTSTRRKLRIFYKYKSKPPFKLEINISNSQESEKEALKQG